MAISYIIAIFFVGVLILLVWFLSIKVYYNYQLNKLRRKYDPNEDKSKHNKPTIDFNSGGIGATNTSEPNLEGLSEPKGRELLQDGTSNSFGENKPINPSPDGIIKKRFRSKKVKLEDLKVREKAPESTTNSEGISLPDDGFSL